MGKFDEIRTIRTMMRDGATDEEINTRFPGYPPRALKLCRDGLAEDYMFEFMGTPRFDTPTSKDDLIRLTGAKGVKPVPLRKH